MNVRPEHFWSRRRAAVAAEAEAEAVAEAAPATPVEDLSDEELLKSLDLPDPDSLTLGDDIRGFMSKAVPAHLRRRALRKLWRLNPVLANLDGLVDYDQDYTDSATVKEGMLTAYQVGKGMLAHVQEMARQAEAALEILEDKAPADPVETAQEIVVAAAPVPVTAKTVEPSVADVPMPRRRMQLSYSVTDEAQA